MGETVLLTGGAGYIGSHTAVYLMKSGYDVVIADNLCNSVKEVIPRVERLGGKAVKFYHADVCREDELERIFAENPTIASVVHFAGLKCVPESVREPLKYYKNNLEATINLIETMARHNVTRLVFSSSATVYGDPKEVPIKEDAPVGGCTNAYGQTKYMSECIMRDVCAANADMSVVLLRYFNPIGADESGLLGEDPFGVPNNLLPYIAQVAVGRREKLYINGNDYPTPDGTGVRDYIHVCDLASGHECALRYTAEHKGCETVNLGTGVGSSVLDVVSEFSRASGRPIPYEFAPRRAGDIAVCYACADKAARLFDWAAKKNLHDMCVDSWRWQSRNPNGYCG